MEGKLDGNRVREAAAALAGSLPVMAFVRIVCEPFGPRDGRLAAMLEVVDARLAAPIAFVQGVFMAKGPMADRHAAIDGWLHPPAGSRVRGEVLSNGRQGDELVMFTVLNSTDRRVAPGRRIGSITLQLGTAALAPDRLADLIEAACDAGRALCAQGFHGADQTAMAAAVLDAGARTGRRGDLPAQDASGHLIHCLPGWIGFVNEPTARALDFPAQAARFGEVRRSRGGAGWMYRLVPEPLDLAIAAHRARVVGLLEGLP